MNLESVLAASQTDTYTRVQLARGHVRYLRPTVDRLSLKIANTKRYKYYWGSYSRATTTAETALSSSSSASKVASEPTLYNRSTHNHVECTSIEKLQKVIKEINDQIAQMEREPHIRKNDRGGKVKVERPIVFGAAMTDPGLTERLLSTAKRLQSDVIAELDIVMDETEITDEGESNTSNMMMVDIPSLKQYHTYIPAFGEMEIDELKSGSPDQEPSRTRVSKPRRIIANRIHFENRLLEAARKRKKLANNKNYKEASVQHEKLKDCVPSGYSCQVEDINVTQDFHRIAHPELQKSKGARQY
ncbi:hypothetical protein BGZ83_010226 [Gryganskiella cystojenkinii]|nr:hypothetical protein BGZ83_010226 [Gryganskiella cystojenkinii]